MTIHYTANRDYPKPDFDTRTWHDQINTALDMIDVDMGSRAEFAAFITAEIWRSGESYAVNDILVDNTDGTLWKCLVLHTSSGTFATERVTNPTYWQNVGLSLRVRGAWAQGTAYTILDHVYDTSEGVSAICIAAHTSTASGTIRTDAVNWVFVVDLSLTLSASVQGQLILQNQIFGG